MKVVALSICVLGLALASPCPAEESAARGAPNAEKLGWRLGCQAYSFNKFTFYEAVDKNASLGLKYIEAYPGQQLSKEKPDVTFDHNMSAETREEVKAKLREAGVTLVNYGVVGLSNDEAANRVVYDFAKTMGIETIVSEPPAEAMELIDKLCQEYDINMAIHNHPRPSKYWNPKRVLELCEGRSKRIGACADTGHWMRSGVDPLDALKMLEGRIVTLHFKELNKRDRQGHDVPWGTGAGDVTAWLAEIKRQGVKAVFSIEYEHNWLNSVPEIAECVTYFDKVAAELSAQ